VECLKWRETFGLNGEKLSNHFILRQCYFVE